MVIEVDEFNGQAEMLPNPQHQVAEPGQRPHGRALYD